MTESNTGTPLPEVRPTATETEPSSSATPSPVTPVEQDTKDRQDIEIKRTPERVNLTATIEPVTGEVPADLLDAVVKDLAQNADVQQGQITIIRAQYEVWNDGSLGCPQPGMVYIQVPVKGYWIELAMDGTLYDYRASETGYFFLCESGLPPIKPPGGTPSQ
jgi:hypothetical protein